MTSHNHRHQITYRVEAWVSGALAPVRRWYFDRDETAANRFAGNKRDEVRRMGSTHKIIVVRDEPPRALGRVLRATNPDSDVGRIVFGTPED